MSAKPHPEVIFSSLSTRLIEKDTHLDIQIYRLEVQKFWTLEIVDESGLSTIWNECFQTDKSALEKALDAVAAFGIRSFLEDHRTRPVYN